MTSLWKGTPGLRHLCKTPSSSIRAIWIKPNFPNSRNNIGSLTRRSKAIYNVILKKGFIHEDPYKHETKISEISNPPDDHFMDSTKDDQMSIRLSMFDSQLDFLLNYYQFSVEFLDLCPSQTCSSALLAISPGTSLVRSPAI